MELVEESKTQRLALLNKPPDFGPFLKPFTWANNPLPLT